jgi:LysM repeat protein
MRGKEPDMKIDTIVLHYSATYADQNLTVKDIDKMHRARGWLGVGYHYVIRRDGVVEQGRPENVVGAHVGGQNTGKLGICCIGGLDRATGPNKGVDNRTPAQIESQIRLIKSLLKKYPGARVVGHRDLAPTQCPGFDVRSWWAKVQKKSAPETKPAPATAPAKTAVIGEDKSHVVQKGETWWSISQMHGLGVADLARANGATPADTLIEGRKLSLVIPPDVPKPVSDVVKDAARSGTSSTTNIATGIGAASSTVAIAKEATDAARESVDGVSAILAAGPWVLLLVVALGAGWWIWRERQRKARMAQSAKGAL